MISSKNCLLLSLGLIIIAIVLIIVGGSVAFTGACLSFIGAGALWDRSLYMAEFEEFEQQIVNGQINEEYAGDFPEFTINLDEISEQDKETLERVMGMKFSNIEEKIDEPKET